MQEAANPHGDVKNYCPWIVLETISIRNAREAHPMFQPFWVTGSHVKSLQMMERYPP